MPAAKNGHVMKKKAIASILLMAVIFAGVATVAFAQSSTTSSTSSTTTTSTYTYTYGRGAYEHPLACRDLTVGETITITDLNGHYYALPSSVTTTTSSITTSSETTTSTSTVTSSETTSSTHTWSSNSASASLVLQVTGIYFSGCTLSINSGTLTLGTTSYSITGGTILLDTWGPSGSGWGTTSAGTFLIQFSDLRGYPTSATLGLASIDFKTGSSEFLVSLYSYRNRG